MRRVEESEQIEVTSDARTLPSLSPRVHFVFLIMHLYREAYFHTVGHDVRLAQFADIALFWRKYRQTLKSSVASFIYKNHLESPCATILGYVDDIFGCSIIQDIGLEITYDPERHLVHTGGKSVRWDGDIVGRLLAGGPAMQH